ncbi:MAG: DUF6484 domain-containing protein [Cocleimonas sp.]|nr:DUF6484 domain-containing protein [Cocleimonas sp.]
MQKQSESKNSQTLETLQEDTQSPLEALLQQKTQSSDEKEVENYPNSLIGQVSTFDESGYPIVNFSINNKEYTKKASSTVSIGIEQIGSDCLICFNHGNIKEPIITGIIQQPETIDEDKPMVIHSESGIILKCGSSRIELTEDGTINIQGMHINSQAYGPHRIKGGSVKIN